MSSQRQFSTRAVHAGVGKSLPDFRPVSPPIYQSVAFLHSMEELDTIFSGKREGFVYTRYGNPTVAALEEAIADLEGGEAAVGFSTGMAAIHAALFSTGIRTGDAIVASQDLYGATYTMLATMMTQLGIKVAFVDMQEVKAVERAVRAERPKVLVAEVISNPLLRVANIPRVAQIAHAADALLVVDNTFTTPLLFNPMKCGTDYVVHSATKYLGGHGDTMGGLVVSNRERCEQVRSVAKLTGGTMGAFDAWLILRGMKTFPLRVRQQCINALHLAAWLQGHPKISRVIYPGLSEHPQHQTAKVLLGEGLFGAMVSFELQNGNVDRAMSFLSSLHLCLTATTLGDIYTELLCPAMSSHRMLSPEERRAIGISDGIIRISVGIEAVEDIIADVGQALEKI